MIQHEAVTIDGDRLAERRQRPGRRFAGDGDPAEELKVPQWTAQPGISINDDAVAAGRRERDLLGDAAVGADRWMLVDDRAEIAAHDDQMDAGVRARPPAIARQRRSRRLLDRERDLLRFTRLERRWRELPEPERPSRADSQR